VILVFQLYRHYYDINIPLFELINGFAWNNDGFWQTITFFGDGAVAFSFLIFFVRRYPSIFWQGFLIAMALGVVVQLAKHVCFVARPALMLSPEHIHIIGAVLRHYSFPSGHSLTAFALAALLAHHLAAPWRYGLLLLAGLIACSRVVVGAHWPVDIVVGALIGWYGARWVLCVSESVNWKYATWGYEQRLGVGFMHVLWLAVALSLWFDKGSYPQAAWLVRSLTLCGFLFWLTQYLRLPKALVEPKAENKPAGING
jgi:membrane-associated phospholipid phosphatase